MSRVGEWSRERCHATFGSASGASDRQGRCSAAFDCGPGTAPLMRCISFNPFIARTIVKAHEGQLLAKAGGRWRAFRPRLPPA